MNFLKNIIPKFLFFVYFSGSMSPVFSQQIYNVDFTGTWLGKLKVQSMVLRVVFRIELKDGKLTALLDSPDQGAKDIPVSDVIVKGDSISLVVNSIGGKYKGVFLKDSTKLDGVWKQGGGIFPLEMSKVEKIEEPKRQQEPQPPYQYNSEDITFENRSAGIKLAGTLTYPKEGTNFPAVVLITGSGPEDRNETVFGHKPFLVISDYLTKNGIAVLRYDDRGVGGSTGDFSKATSLDFASDAEAAVDYLKTRNEINKKEIGLIGHSEGGLIAPIVASKDKDIAFIVLLAGPGLPGNKLLLIQSELIMKSEREQPEKIERAIDLNKKIYSLVDTTTDTTVIHQKLKEVLEKYYDSLSEEDKKEIPDLKLFIEQQFKTITSPWFSFFLRYDPRPALEKVKCPVLALNGGNDLQVPPKEDLSEIEKALKKGGNKNYKIVELPGLNHLFQDSATGKISEYAKIDETFSPKALEIMVGWIKKITKK
jgi:pimeloyl-ACP methyl ester carboxylesterase